MTDEKWSAFFKACAHVLVPGARMNPEPNSGWCAWTTFTRLSRDAGYWTCGLPLASEVLPTHIADGGTWGQPFPYSDLAHIIIPRVVAWERMEGSKLLSGTLAQPVNALSEALHRVECSHRVGLIALEIKLF